jgi:hypothetical protein
VSLYTLLGEHFESAVLVRVIFGRRWGLVRSEVGIQLSCLPLFHKEMFVTFFVFMLIRGTLDTV